MDKNIYMCALLSDVFLHWAIVWMLYRPRREKEISLFSHSVYDGDKIVWIFISNWFKIIGV